MGTEQNQPQERLGNKRQYPHPSASFHLAPLLFRLFDCFVEALSDVIGELLANRAHLRQIVAVQPRHPCLNSDSSERNAQRNDVVLGVFERVEGLAR